MTRSPFLSLAVDLARAEAGYQKDIAALYQVARNLATTLELNGLGGIASLNQQLLAHGLASLSEDGQ